MTGRIQIKGIREGLLITLGEGEWAELRNELLSHLDGQGEFLRGARLAIDVKNLAINPVDLQTLQSEIGGRGLSLWAVLSESPLTESSAQALNLATRINQATPQANKTPADTIVHQGEPALLFRRTLRSGFSIQHAGHVVVIGDVNPGAEIVASGDIIVWGHLRGMVHAGAEGDESAMICALDLSPTQLRIAGQIALSPQRKGKVLPELARLVDRQVVAEIWELKGKH